MDILQFGYGGVGGINATPLVAFNVIIDEDVSLISYIIKCVRNYGIFDLDKLHEYTMEQIVSEIYLRTYSNPLYFLMKNEKDKDFLDQCYKEFMETQEFYEEFIVSTDFYELMGYFISSGEVKPSILCKTEKEKDIVENDELLSRLNIVMFQDITSARSIYKYHQFYLYRIEDLKNILLPEVTARTFYISSMGLNLTENKQDVRDNEFLKLIDSSYSRLSVFDMYKSEIIGRAIY